jgi:putative CocE/NonD family hydrolase
VNVNAADAPESSYRLLDHYEQDEYWIPMRDGVLLFTTVYKPKQMSGTLPILLLRTPYSGLSIRRPQRDLAEADYIFVVQDARGTYRSGGMFIELSPPRDKRTKGATVDESTDTHDTVDWLLRHVRGNNGKVGIYGGSYEGFYAQASIRQTHPAIKAADVEIIGDWNYRHGTFMLGDNFEFYVDYKPKNGPDAPHLNYVTRDPYELFMGVGPLSQVTSKYFNPESNPTWDDLVRHDTLDDYWKERDLSVHLRDLHCAVLNVGGWFDQYSVAGPIDNYHAVAKQNPQVTNLLVMGPWSHAATILYGTPGRRIGDIDFASDTAAEYRRRILLPFFEHYLKGRPADLPKVLAFETGSNRWREYPQWPPAGAAARTLYLREEGSLLFERPKTDSAYDEYVSNPAKPVPFMDLVSAAHDTLMAPEYMTADQRFAARRPDVLVYATPPLVDDVTVVGPVTANLFVSTSGTDSDWVVKLIDVYPSSITEPVTYPDDQSAYVLPDVSAPDVALAGYQLMVRGEPMRGKFRNGWDKPEPFVPGRVTEVTYTMADVNHTFLKGHRIMVQVQSSVYPFADLNPQSFMHIPDARPSDFRAVTQRVFRDRNASSNVVLHVLTDAATH